MNSCMIISVLVIAPHHHNIVQSHLYSNLAAINLKKYETRFCIYRFEDINVIFWTKAPSGGSFSMLHHLSSSKDKKRDHRKTKRMISTSVAQRRAIREDRWV